VRSAAPLLLAAGVALTPAASFAALSPERAQACEAMKAIEAPGLVIDKAEAQQASTVTLPMMQATLPVPDHCLVRGRIDPRKGVGGQDYAIGFEVRLPADWNGRFLFQGGGGLDGRIVPALGLSPGGAPGLARGFAVVSTDAGHEGDDASFAADQQARLDYAYVALGKVTEQAKAIVARYYGKPAQYSYFAGCSNGGRQGMMAAQRYPDEFDGILAGDPGFRLSRAAIGEAWDTQHFIKIAPRDAQGRPVLAQAVTEADMKLVSDAVLKQCDALDGLADGMINDVKACHFDVKTLQCKAGQTQGCLSKDKVAALAAIQGGAHDSKGRRLYSGWYYDAGMADQGWRFWKLTLNATLGFDSLARYFSTPPQHPDGPMGFDFDKLEEQTAQTGAINDPTSTYLTSFAARGSHLLIYQGVSDPVFSAEDIVGWYDKLNADNGGMRDSVRLFLIPGMGHCAGGPATDRFDALTALQDWVEKHQAPDRIRAEGQAFPGVTRPLCAYPKVARYQGGDVSSEASFACR
jgi:feruloyl esterase